jgi:broad specificity phosphatase PhoE
LRLILTRHGETVENRDRICQGQTHGQLSEEGISQAKKLGIRLKDEKIDVIYSSDLGRCVNTTKEIARYHPGVKIEFDKRIRERFWGEIQGEKRDENFKWEDKHKIPGVESDKEVCKRVKDFLDEAYSKHENDTVLVVCHGGPLTAFLVAIHDKSSTEFDILNHFDNTSISEFVIKEDGKHHVKLMNCTKHLNCA